MPKEIKNIINASKYTLLFEPKYLWLKTLLFEVIETQAGRSILNDFKTISHFTHCYRDTQNEKELSNLNRYFLKLSSKKKHIIIKSFRLFFELYNLLEDGYRCDLNTIKEKESGQGSLEILIKNARKKRIPLKQLLKTLNSSLCQLIWTAHPTETHSLSSLRHLQAIIPLLKSYKENLLDSKKEKLAIQLKTHITHLWQSHSVSSKKMHVLDELRRTLFYLEHNFTSALTELYQTLSMNLKRHYKHILAPKELSPFLGLGFWPGGDRDGNPYVTATISKQALLLIKRSSMRILLEQIELLIKQLSNSTNQIQVSLSLKRSINQDIKTFPVFSKRTETLNTDEPYRKKLDFMRLKCLNTLQRIDQNARNIGLSETLIGNNNDARPNQTGPSYTSLEPFIDELYIIADSLNKNKGSIITQNNLNPLLFLAQVLARISLDFRQHSDHHHHCIKNCFSYLEINCVDTSSYFANLINECRSKRVLGLNRFYKYLDETSQDTFESFKIFKDSQKSITPNSTNSYIISMTEKKEDVFAVLLLAKEAGLIDIQKGKVSDAMLDIVPLFETKSALDGATAMMQSLFEDQFYRSYLTRRNHTQEIMLGFSDSNKDVGPLGSHLSIYQLQKNLLDLAKRYKIHLRFFYGRGGTISRGGGPMNKAIQALPLLAIENMKITQQGEMLAFHYLNADIAKRHLEQITCSLFERLLFSKPKKELNILSKTQNQHLFLELIETSCKHYEALTKESAYFPTFFHQITPIDLMAHMHIGSRPSKRKAQNSSQPTQDYRAISWVFGWMQSRILISGFYGVGEALKQAEQKHGLAILRDWYKNWPFFQTFIQNIQMVLVKADMLIAPQYLQLDPSEDAKALFERISDEHLEATEYVLQITKQNTLLENSPKIRDQILRRNPFLDPLNIMQIALLAQWRKQKRPIKETPHSLKNQLIETVNGIAAGIRNYG